MSGQNSALIHWFVILKRTVYRLVVILDFNCIIKYNGRSEWSHTHGNSEQLEVVRALSDGLQVITLNYILNAKCEITTESIENFLFNK